MAKRNPYLSTLIKTLRSSYNEVINTRLNELGDTPTKESLLAIFNEFNIQLPKIGKKLSDEEKQRRKEERERIRAEREQQRNEKIDKQVEILRNIILNGTDEQKQAIENVINDYSKAIRIKVIESQLEAKKAELEALQSQLEELNT